MAPEDVQHELDMFVDETRRELHVLRGRISDLEQEMRELRQQPRIEV